MNSEQRQSTQGDAIPQVAAWPKWLHDESLEVLRNVDTQFRATGQASARIERLINAIAGATPQVSGGGEVEAVLAAVREELERATAKFPTWPTDPLHASGVVQEESGELAKAVLQAVYEPHKSTIEDVATEAFQTAAMAVRFLVSMARYDWTPCAQHRQE